ncbi:hypothetical protein GOV14_01025 [Candidatus Pacearchaeota archaeon]|nr:hypothetical protein [Candidatus Pacearchaeota archaeon]
MANNNDWKNLVPEQIADYLEKNKLVDRFRSEFGQQTRELGLKSDPHYTPTTQEERGHMGEE